jgi:V8-like Glu-specific endopeptidase
MKKSILFGILIITLNLTYAQTKINPTEYPYNYVVKLIMHKNGSTFHRTGIIINKNSIVTNAHNVFGKDSISIYPGYSKLEKEPFGKIIVKCIKNKTIFYPKEFLSKNQNKFYDFAVIKYSNKDVFDRILKESNNKKFNIEPVNNIKSKTINISGYPYFRWFEFWKQKKAKVHYHNTSNKHYITENILLNYKMNTRGGSSGSPLWIDKNGDLIIIGIHKSGKGYRNQGILYDEKRILLSKNWIDK